MKTARTRKTATSLSEPFHQRGCRRSRAPRISEGKKLFAAVDAWPITGAVVIVSVAGVNVTLAAR
jgi:hypothetical protein